MTAQLSTILEQIALQRPLHAKKLAVDLADLETAADEFSPLLDRYLAYLEPAAARA